MDMFRIYLSEFKLQMDESRFKYYLDQLPPVLKNRVKKYRKWEDQYSSLFGKLLIIKGCEGFGVKADLQDLRFNSFGKPYLENAPDFNLTHSGNLVACAIASEGNAGLDVEQVVPQEYTLFKESFTNHEWKNIEESEDPLTQFYTFWTIKEAVIKANGCGHNVSLKRISIQKDFAEMGIEKWFFKKVSISKEYIMHIASDKKISEVEVIRIDF
jgi:4'-phosphopantetheinyl transferase